MLTKRETEIILLVSVGFTSKEIADKLFISIRTVETHRNNIKKKLEVKTSAAMINRWREIEKASIEVKDENMKSFINDFLDLINKYK